MSKPSHQLSRHFCSILNFVLTELTEKSFLYLFLYLLWFQIVSVCIRYHESWNLTWWRSDSWLWEHELLSAGRKLTSLWLTWDVGSRELASRQRSNLKQSSQNWSRLKWKSSTWLQRFFREKMRWVGIVNAIHIYIGRFHETMRNNLLDPEPSIDQDYRSKEEKVSSVT